ncbi:MAG TPA: class E sortase [Acidimicrobiia bacterium]|nr:class E sortase [Acidimicrobiia bacterium]
MRTVIGAVGRVLVTVGLLILLFVAYQLWGTGIYEARAQSDLESQFDRDLARQDSPRTTTTTSGTTPATTTPIELPPTPAAGDPVGVITIDKLGVDKVVVEGTTVPDLRRAPGHYEGSAMPGQLGNAAIAGHRTTYGAPFGDLDQLVRGDTISVRTLRGTWEYEVLPDYPIAVKPSQTEVLDPTIDEATGQPLATLTLTTCEPKYQATERLVVKAQLSDTNRQSPLPASDQRTELVLDTGLSGGSESRAPVFLWGLIAAVIGGLWWLIFHRYSRWTAWVAGAIPFLVVLFVFYSNLERVLPNNY